MNPMIQRLLARLTLAFLLISGIAFSQSKPYRGAEYRTKASYTYGRFEVRMKSAAGSGILTTLFTYHDSSPFSVANWNEIDIEIMGRYSNEVQYNTITPNRVDHVRRQVVKFNPHQSFHVHAFEWTPDYVAWFIDGYEVYRQTEAHVATLTRPQKIMMNMWQPTAIAWAGAFDPNTLPFYGYYDWVKYYAYTPGEGDNFTLQWTDNFDNWDQSRWDKATHTFDGNNAQFIHDNIVFRNGYMILCLTAPEATGYRGGTIIDLDIDPPYLVWARAEANRFLVFFSEEVEKVSAETISNYTIAGATVHGASLQPGNKVVALHTDSLDLTQSFVLVASGIKDRSPAALQMGLQFTNVANSLALPLGFNLGGTSEANFRTDQIWDYYQEYGASGGTARTRPAGTTISGTSQPEIYQTEREGLNFYRVRVPEGRYRVTLMMAESEHDLSGRRVFDIYAEGRLLVDNLDIIAEVGKNVALEKTFSDIAVTDGVLDFYFDAEADAPTLSGLLVERTASTAVRQSEMLPADFALGIYPNPFNPSAKITYSLAKPGMVELTLFDMNGRHIRTLVREFRTAGSQQIDLDTRGLSAGIYFVRLQFEGKLLAQRKAVYLK